MNKILALIPARGGSKRIPGKNSRLFMGKPIIQYSIDAASASEIFTDIWVSTDKDEIAELCRTKKIHVHDRSAEAASDVATISEVLKEVLVDLNIHQGTLCLIYATAPFVDADMLKKSYREFVTSGADSLLPVVRYSFPIQRAMKSEDGWLQMIQPENMHVRSQDLPASFHDAGLFFWINVEKFLQSGKVFMDKTLAFEVDEMYCQDIDNESDWKAAELKYKIMHAG
jgi:N-acylneuraminate cytidylyltransferase